MRSRVAAVLLALSTSLLAGNWEEPENGVMTAKEADAYLVYFEKTVKIHHDAAVDVAKLSKAKASVDQLKARTKKMEDDDAAALAAAGLEKNEAEWVAQRFSDVWVVLNGETELEKMVAAAKKPIEAEEAKAEKLKAEAAELRKKGDASSEKAAKSKDDEAAHMLDHAKKERASMESGVAKAKEDIATRLERFPKENVKLVRERAAKYGEIYERAMKDR